MANITMRILSHDDASQAVRIATKVHLTGNPPLMNIGCKHEDIGVLNDFIESVVVNGYTYGAFDNEKLVAVRPAYMCKRGDKAIHKSNQKEPKLAYYQKKLCEIADILDEKAKIFERYDVDSVMHFYGLAVVDEYKQMGLGFKLTEYAINRAVEKGIRCFFTRSTSAFSARIYEKLGFEKLSEMAYDDFLGDDGQPVFQPPEPHKFMTMWGKFIEKP